MTITHRKQHKIITLKKIFPAPTHNTGNKRNTNNNKTKYIL